MDNRAGSLVKISLEMGYWISDTMTFSHSNKAGLKSCYCKLLSLKLYKQHEQQLQTHFKIQTFLTIIIKTRCISRAYFVFCLQAQKYIMRHANSAHVLLIFLDNLEFTSNKSLPHQR